MRNERTGKSVFLRLQRPVSSTHPLANFHTPLQSRLVQFVLQCGEVCVVIVVIPNHVDQLRSGRRVVPAQVYPLDASEVFGRLRVGDEPWHVALRRWPWWWGCRRG